MNITFYNSSAEKNRLNKNGYLKKIIEMDGTLRTSCSVSNPVINIELNPETVQMNIIKRIFIVDDQDRYTTTNGSIKLIYDLISKIITANYVYIPDFNRYYFITDITSIRNNLWQITMRVDVLMSYYGEIKNLNAFVSRNEYTFDPLIKDDLVNYFYDKEIEYYIPENISTVTELITNPSTNTNNAIVCYLTDDELKTSFGMSALDNLPSVNAYLTGSNMSTQYLCGVTGILYDLCKAVYKDDTILSFIKSVMIYPYDIECTADPSIIEIFFGGNTQGSSGHRYALTDTFKYPNRFPDRIVIADFNFPDAESFIDYSPFTTYEIYIPYCSYVSLSSESICGKHLKVFYVVNYEEGTSTAYIYNVTDGKVLFSNPCVLGTRVSLSATNSREISDQKNALALNTGINLASSVLSTVGGVYTGNPMMTVGGVVGATKSITSAISTYNQLYDLGKVGINSSTDGYSNLQKVHIKMTSAKPRGYDSDFASLYGKPLNQYKKISDLSGMTYIGECHLENFPSATDGELTEIDQILKSGILI